MSVNLSSIGIEKGKQYETIITTENSKNIKNAAPIGVICTGDNTIMCRIFKGGKTLENIMSRKEFVVNICKNPELFTLSTIGNLTPDYFNDDLSLKNADAYFKCKAGEFKESVKQSDPIKKNSKAIVFKSEVTELVILNETSAMNRSLGYIIESLANLTRIDYVDSQTKELYLKQFREAKRVVSKVGYKKEKKAIDKIKKELIKKGYDV